MTWRAALVVAFVLANAGCWATGSAETIRQQPGRGGLVLYTPERDGWFGFSKGRDKALAKARGEAAKNCDPAEFEELESGKVTVGRETVEGNTQGGKSEWITPAAGTDRRAGAVGTSSHQHLAVGQQGCRLAGARLTSPRSRSAIPQSSNSPRKLHNLLAVRLGARVRRPQQERAVLCDFPSRECPRQMESAQQ